MATIREASVAAGLAPQTLYQQRFKHRNLHIENELRIMHAIEDKAVDASALIRTLSMKAVQTVAALMTMSENERIQLDAAKDLLDRNPETSKTQKLQVDSSSISSNDVKALAAAMVESARLRQENPLPPGDSIVMPPSHQLVASIPSSNGQ